MKTLVVVPAYNEERSIHTVIKNIKTQEPNIDVVVINDGSTDNTYLEAKKAGALVINLPQNLGIGGAVQTGYIYAKNNNYDIVIQIDGDGQHNPKDIGKLTYLLQQDQADMVIGSRFIENTNYKASVMRKIGINFFSKLVSILCKEKYYDTTSGYRAVNKKCIKLFSCYYPKDYPEVEAIVFAKKRGIRIKEVSVSMDERIQGKSSITPLKAAYYMFKVTCTTLLQPR